MARIDRELICRKPFYGEVVSGLIVDLNDQPPDFRPTLDALHAVIESLVRPLDLIQLNIKNVLPKLQDEWSTKGFLETNLNYKNCFFLTKNAPNFIIPGDRYNLLSELLSWLNHGDAWCIYQPYDSESAYKLTNILESQNSADPIQEISKVWITTALEYCQCIVGASSDGYQLDCWSSSPILPISWRNAIAAGEQELVIMETKHGPFVYDETNQINKLQAPGPKP